MLKGNDNDLLIKSNSLAIKINSLFRQSVGYQSKGKTVELRKSLLHNNSKSNNSDKFLPVDIRSSVNRNIVNVMENDNNIEEKLVNDYLSDEMRDSKSFAIEISNDIRDRSSSIQKKGNMNYLKEIARVAAEIMGKDTSISVSKATKDTKKNGDDDYVIFDLTEGDSLDAGGENRTSSGFGSSVPFMSSVSYLLLLLSINYSYQFLYI